MSSFKKVERVKKLISRFDGKLNQIAYNPKYEGMQTDERLKKMQDARKLAADVFVDECKKIFSNP